MPKIIALFLALLLAVSSALPVLAAAPGQQSDQTIVDIAVADGRFSTLVTALETAGLVDTLSGDGPFTVFAPTDDAFAALPDGTVEALLSDIPALTQVLLYHVVSGKVLASDVVNLDAADTLLGEAVDVTFDGTIVKINDAQVIITDIEASNGVIHVIDAVLLPPGSGGEMPGADDGMPSDQTIVDIAVADGRFTTLVAALQAADLVDTLSGTGPFTVFAPTDEAFAALPEGTIDSLLADIPTLKNILLYHVVSGKVLASDVVNLTSANTVLGRPVHISVEGNTVKINDAQVIITDIEAANGVIHVIDAVLTPPTTGPSDGDGKRHPTFNDRQHYNRYYNNNHNRYRPYYKRGYDRPHSFGQRYNTPRHHQGRYARYYHRHSHSHGHQSHSHGHYHSRSSRYGW